MKKIIYLSGLCSCCLVMFWVFASAAQMAGTEPQPGIIAVTNDDLKAAGFTDIKNLAPTGSEQYGSVKYFQVKETVAPSHSEWQKAANMVAVMIMTRHDQWLYNNGQLETIEIAGRSRVRASKSGYYMVITGPDAAKTSALMSILLSK